MKKIIVFILSFFIFSLYSCNDNTNDKNKDKKIQQLEDSISYYKNMYLEKDSLYDSVFSEYLSLKEKMTKHIKYVYTVYDDVIRDEDGYEWDFSEFLSENCGDYGYIHEDDFYDYIKDHYDKWDIIEMFDISGSDFEDDYEPDYDERWEPRGL